MYTIVYIGLLDGILDTIQTIRFSCTLESCKTFAENILQHSIGIP